MGPTSLLITFAGRLIKEKGIDDFINAATSICKEKKDVIFFVAGTGPLLNEIKSKVAKLDRIVIVGRLEYDEMMDLLYQSDILINPSKYPEGLPTIILEGGINRCAVIATPQGGTPEVINRDTGILIQTGNVQQLIDAINKLIEDRCLVERLSNNLYNKVRNEFDWNALAITFMEKISQ